MSIFTNAIFALLALVNAVVFASSLDDAFIDACFWLRRLRRRLAGLQDPVLHLDALGQRPEAPFAVLVPAWHESEVIARMIEHTSATLDYRTYDLFVGTYQNDPDTAREVDRMVRRHPNVHRVEVGHPGPTCKADCLNALVDAVFRQEAATRRTFAGFVVHDSEDVIHPQELKVFNHLVGRMDLIQLPVLSLERTWNQWVAGTYQDDFAECHTKDLVVREHLTGLVPCAGTGMCYSHRAMVALAEANGQAPFNTATLTEDYDFSFRLQQAGMRQAFVKIPLPVTTPGRHDLLGVHELFPDSFRTAYRQRARWILGISLQGWETLGWKGDLRAKYFMFRDRKGLFTSLITPLAYGLFLVLGAWMTLAWLGTGMPPLPVDPYSDTWVARLMMVNGLFMLNRVVQRFIFVRHIYGLAHGLLSIPRILVGNAVNCAAALRAWHQYAVHRLTGTPLAWDKTTHTYPETGELVPIRPRLGEILVQWGILDAPLLEGALAQQRSLGLRLGRILVAQGLLSEAVVADAVAFQEGLPRAALDMGVPDLTWDLLPAALALRHGWVPLGLWQGEQVCLGAAAAPLDAARAEALEHLHQAPRFCILTESEVACALTWMLLGGARSQDLGPEPEDLLRRCGRVRAGVDPSTLAGALASYTYGQHGSLATFLAARNLLETTDDARPNPGVLVPLTVAAGPC